MSQQCNCGAAIDNGLCQCSLRDSDCIRIKGSGRTTPLEAVPYIDTHVDNMMSRNADGILVRLPAQLRDIPRCSVTHSVGQAVGHETRTPLAFDTTLWGHATMHAGVSNTRITFTTAGVYIVTLNVAFVANGVGDRGVLIRKNGTEHIAGGEKFATTGEITGFSIVTQEEFQVGEFVEAVVRQDSGGNLNVTATPYSPIFSVVYRGRVPVAAT